MPVALYKPYDMVPIVRTVLMRIGVNIRRGRLCWPDKVITITEQDGVDCVRMAWPTTMEDLEQESSRSDVAWRRMLPVVHSVLEKSSPEDRYAREREEKMAGILSALVNPLVDAVSVEAERRANERKRKEAEEKARKEAEEVNRRREEELAKRKALLEAGLKEAQEEALQVLKERHLDFRPYLALEVARGERPGIWRPPAFVNLVVHLANV